jgi:hypothetical protein
MLTKIIPFAAAYFKRKESPPLTSKMIVALLNALEKQKKEIPFGSINVRGSFTSLITRGLIVGKELTINGHKEFLWQVTEDAIAMLENLGIET